MNADILHKSLADLEGEWPPATSGSGLAERCHLARKIPITSLTNDQVAMLLQQKIGIAFLIDLAKFRLESGIDDGSEIFDGRLKEAYELAIHPHVV